ncbi:hypothetical protein FQA39_LY07445 [Lamprigera yunnana]|nr:hypothetical protein FQA39_LY07445 [Lamprigera yunnana]
MIIIYRHNKLSICIFLSVALICTILNSFKNKNATNVYETSKIDAISLKNSDSLPTDAIEKLKASRSVVLNTKPFFKPLYNIHAFYYAWYANKEIDGFYKHWNRTSLSNSKNRQTMLDVASNFYPSLGCYSSQDVNIIDVHLQQLKENGIGVIVVSWTPPDYVDSPTTVLPLLFQFATKHKIKIALHVELYTDRTPINLAYHLKFYISQYKNNPALYKVKKQGKDVPVFYIYDSYLTPAVSWMEILNPKSPTSIRGTDFDAFFIGLLVDVQHRYHIKKSHFDGFYTYFAANSFSYGSTWKNWKRLQKFASQNELIFLPSVGPGYEDTRIRPWNSKNSKHRRHGHYYDVAWRTAINSGSSYITITSFNQWHEGTQIEPAIPKSIHGFSYSDYEPDGSHFYLNLTKWWIEQFNKTVLKN